MIYKIQVVRKSTQCDYIDLEVEADGVEKAGEFAIEKAKESDEKEWTGCSHSSEDVTFTTNHEKKDEQDRPRQSTPAEPQYPFYFTPSMSGKEHNCTATLGSTWLFMDGTVESAVSPTEAMFDLEWGV